MEYSNYREVADPCSFSYPHESKVTKWTCEHRREFRLISWDECSDHSKSEISDLCDHQGILASRVNQLICDHLGISSGILETPPQIDPLLAQKDKEAFAESVFIRVHYAEGPEVDENTLRHNYTNYEEILITLNDSHRGTAYNIVKHRVMDLLRQYRGRSCMPDRCRRKTFAVSW